MSSAEVRCFHCGEPVPDGPEFTLEQAGESLPMCCAGCLAVASLIHDAGLDRYYRFRQSLARRAGDDLEEARTAWQSVDAKPALWGERTDSGAYLSLLQTEGIQCAACAWLIRSQLARVRGVSDVRVDIASGYTTVNWKPEETRLSAIALSLFELGYKPHLPLFSEQERGRQQERKRSLRRLGIAGLGMMQVMMYAVALYTGEGAGMSQSAERFLEWVSLLVTTPVMLYSGRVFFEGAWRGLRAGRAGMDLPVALAIGIAYLASCIAFFSGSGQVWFDSVVMFIFFLLLGRHVEMVLRHRNQQSGAVLARLLPEWVQRLGERGAETVLASDLRAGDRVRVRPGESFPADGIVRHGATEVNEALLTGESWPRPKSVDDPVMAGSINLLQPVQVEVTEAGMDSTVSALGRLLDRARTRRGRTTLLAERVAGRFVLAVLLVAAVAASWWLYRDPAQVLPVTLAVLVVSCPCALSLAAPSAVAAASRALLRRGIILTRGDALETLAAVDTVLLDKTGTMTSGRPRLVGTTLNPERSGISESAVLGIAAALEGASAHPLAQAFREHRPEPEMERVESVPGMGLRGWSGGREYRIGSAAFAATGQRAVKAGEGTIFLADETGWLARFELRDGLRQGVRSALEAFRADGLEVAILSGDTAANVAPLASELGVETWHAELAPGEKLDMLEQYKEAGRRVLMIGDGINDAPVLAGADVSIAVQGGTELANSAADLILTGRSLDLVRQARELALATRRVVAENMGWAIAYNAIMIPLAVAGLLKPWMAAIGMSASSLLVVLNAARLGRRRSGERPVTAVEPHRQPA